MGTVTERSRIRFGPFELDLRSQELLKSGRVVKLPNQSFRVLALLAGRPGELVTREEIQRAIWDAETFVDFEQGLNHCIKHIRGALNDDAQTPRFIETLPKRGYLFVAPVEIEGAPVPVPSPSALDVAAAAAARPARSRWQLVAAVVAAVGMIGFVLVAGPWKSAGSSTQAVVAVLPFDNMTGDPAQDYFSDGMTEELSAQLARLNPEQLAVISRTSAFKFKGSRAMADQIGRELGASYLLEGSVRTAGNRVRITAQLIRASDQRHVWSDTYDRDLGSVLQLEREVAERIAEVINVKVGVRSAPPAHRPNWQAYSAYLKGRHLLLDTKTEADIRLAIQYFQEATRTDPEFALGYTGIADGHIELAGFATVPVESYDTAREAVATALRLDPSLAEAHVSSGRIAQRADWDVIRAEHEFKTAIALKPEYEEGYHSYSHLLIYLGRFDEAIEQSRKLLRLDPLSPHMNAHLGLLYMQAGRLDAAVAQLKKTIDGNPGYIRAYHFLGVTYEVKGDYALAVQTLTTGASLRAGSTETLADLAHALAMAGRKADARQLLETLEAERRGRFVPYSDFAIAYLGLGERDRALEALKRAVDTREEMVTLNTEPRFAPLKDDPRFQELVRRSGLSR
jgi:TolB-like protein/DNA-binding winged helix-turn-helix (wHTH) protein/Tfp pilus assembly protein PilF